MIQANSSKAINKATALKKLIQQACHSNKPQASEASTPFSSRLKSSQSKVSMKNNSTSKENFQSQSKTSSSQQKGLLITSTKNKQNVCINKKFDGEMRTQQSESSKPRQMNGKVKSMKHIKLNTLSTSIELPKLLKTVFSSTNKEKRALKFESSLDSLNSITSRDRERQRSKRDILKRPKGFKITDFNLGKKLGKGRFGSVRLAQEKTTKFILAIKTINIAQLKESEMETQLIQEIKLQMYCNHPNILKMYGCFHDSNNIYLLLELGVGCLFQQLRGEKHFEEEKTAYYGKQIIESLKYLHCQSIIHRDIKPENILISYGVLKLSDFGWSTYSPTLKRQTFCGTLDYVSPEIVNGEYYDQKVDIWSLGVLFYELAVGKAPFEDPNNNQEATYDKILSAETQFPSRVSTEIQDLISRILLKDPRERLSMNEIECHAWFQKYKTSGRYISKEIWDVWERLKGEER